MSIPAWTRRNPLAAYVILACAISWIAVSPLVAAWFGLLPPIAPAWHWVGALGPITAAALVTVATGGRAGLRDLLSRMTRWRVGAAWPIPPGWRTWLPLPSPTGLGRNRGGGGLRCRGSGPAAAPSAPHSSSWSCGRSGTHRTSPTDITSSASRATRGSSPASWRGRSGSRSCTTARVGAWPTEAVVVGAAGDRGGVSAIG